MPPKSKFTKEEIIQTALKLVEREGIEALLYYNRLRR